MTSEQREFDLRPEEGEETSNAGCIPTTHSTRFSSSQPTSYFQAHPIAALTSSYFSSLFSHLSTSKHLRRRRCLTTATAPLGLSALPPAA